MKCLWFLSLLFAAHAASAADPFALRVRPQLPPSIRTVGDAAAYYLAPTGYTLHANTPTTGDQRRTLRPLVRSIPDTAQPITIETALLSLVAADVELYIDHQARAVAYGVGLSGATTGNSRVHHVSLFDTIDAPLPELVDDSPSIAESRPSNSLAADAAPEIHEPSAGAKVDPPPVVDMGTVAEPTAAEIASPTDKPATAADLAAALGAPEPIADAEPVAPSYTYDLVAGETLDQAIARWCAREGFVLEYRAAFRIPVRRDITLDATTFRDAVSQALSPLWNGRYALIAEETSTKTLIVRTP